MDRGQIANAYGVDTFPINTNVIGTGIAGYFANKIGCVGDMFFNQFTQWPGNYPGLPGYFVVEAARVTPPLALIPLLILWLGIEEAPKIAIVFLSSFFPIYLNSLTAIESVELKLKEVAKTLHFSSWETFRLLTIPAALPGILTGLRVGFGYSWRALVGAELIAASSGLGFMISEASEFSKTSVVFVGIFSIIVIGVCMDRLLSWAINRYAKFFSV